MLALLAMADRTHLRFHPRAHESELKYLAEEVVDSQSSCPDLQPGNPPRGRYLVL